MLRPQRVAYAQITGREFTEDVMLLHWCDAPLCAHADVDAAMSHVREGTGRDNMLGRSQRVRYAGPPTRWTNAASPESNAHSAPATRAPCCSSTAGIVNGWPPASTRTNRHCSGARSAQGPRPCTRVSSNTYDREMDWWSELFAEISAPAWTAGLVQAFIGAGAAFGAAVVILRVQLRHDRELAREQRTEDLALTEAQRKADRADMLGRRVIESGEALQHLNYVQLLELLRKPRKESWRTAQFFPGLNEAHTLHDEIKLVFPKAVADAFWDVWIARLWRWELFRARLEQFRTEFAELPDDVFGQAYDSAFDAQMAPDTNILVLIGASWVRWNGVGDPAGPDILAQENFRALHPSAGDRGERWRQEEVASFRKTFLDRVEKITQRRSR